MRIPDSQQSTFLSCTYLIRNNPHFFSFYNLIHNNAHCPSFALWRPDPQESAFLSYADLICKNQHSFLMRTWSARICIPFIRTPDPQESTFLSYNDSIPGPVYTIWSICLALLSRRTFQINSSWSHSSWSISNLPYRALFSCCTLVWHCSLSPCHMSPSLSPKL